MSEIRLLKLLLTDWLTAALAPSLPLSLTHSLTHSLTDILYKMVAKLQFCQLNFVNLLWYFLLKSVPWGAIDEKS